MRMSGEDGVSVIESAKRLKPLRFPKEGEAGRNRLAFVVGLG